MPTESSRIEKRVLLLAPTQRDADAICTLLERSNIECAQRPTISALCGAIRDGAGAVIVSEESLAADGAMLAGCMASQPVWSDLPVIVLSRAGVESKTLAQLLGNLGNMTVMERPVRLSTFQSVVISALRARDRQYQVRDHVVALENAESALRSSEERLRLAVQTGKLGIWDLDPRTREMEASAACKANFGRGPDEPFTYEDLWTAIHPDDVQRVEEAVQKTIAEKHDYDVEYRNIWPDGSIHWVLARAYPTHDAEGMPNRLTGVTLDITDRKTIEENRRSLLDAERAARAEAERTSRIKDEFLATLSHELRTPLNAVLGWAQIIRMSSAKPEDITQGVEIIERNARAQAQIIEDLLDMSRIISGKVRLDVQRVDLTAVIVAAIATVQPAAHAKEIKIQTVMDPQAGQIAGDPNRLQQVFWNLLSNAVKFTSKGGHVKLVLERVDSHIEIAVNDDGEGIDPAFVPFVFDRFRQADATRTRHHGGLGLGLAIVKQIVELHGGSISVQSEGVGQGTVFTVALPLAAVNAAAAPLRKLHPPSATTDTYLGVSNHINMAGVKVLVVDDEPDARSLLQRLLEDCEASVFAAASSHEAVNMLQAERPHVLISDIGMPEEDGYALIRRVRTLAPEHGGNTPAVALTAYARAEDRVTAIVAGFQHHLAKPVEPAELIAIVASLAGRGSSEV